MTRKLGRLALAGVSLLCAVLLAACGSSTPVLRYVSISPTAISIDNFTTEQFTATAYYSDGSQQNANATVGWFSTNSAVATISQTGVATALSNGTTTITITQAGATASATLTVARTLQSIAITPVTATVAAGQTEQYDAMGTFLNADGTITTSDITSVATWNALNATVATISASGLATTLVAGSSGITATFDTLTSNTATLTVGPAIVTSITVSPATAALAVGNTTALTAVETFTDGTSQAPTTPVTWAVNPACTPAGAATLAAPAPTTSNPNADYATEIVVADAAGTCTVTATELANPTYTAGSSAVTVTTGSAYYAYVSNNLDSTISQYGVTAASTTPLAALTPATVASTSPTQFIVNPNGLFAYAIDSLSNVTLFDVAPSTGLLTASSPLFSIPAGAGNGNYMTIDPTGRFLYVTDDGGTGQINGFVIDPVAGTLTPIAAVTDYTVNLNAPESVLIDHTGTYLYAINSAGTTGTVSAYSINQTTGALTPLATPTIATGVSPFLGAISPNNLLLFVANSGDGTVSAYTITAGSGILVSAGAATPITGAVAPINAVVDPTNSFLYVLDTGSGGTSAGNVYGYTINSTTGVIGSAISGGTAATGISPTGIILDPTGVLLAVDNNGSATISPFAVTTGTGAISADATAATGNGPLFVTFYVAP